MKELKTIGVDNIDIDTLIKMLQEAKALGATIVKGRPVNDPYWQFKWLDCYGM